MTHQDPPTAIVPIDLGDAATFEQHVFPLAYYDDGDNISKGNLLIAATLEEMEKIKELSIDLNKNEDFIFNTRVKLEALRVKKAKLQDKRKSLNPFKAFLNYRAARLFHEGSKALYLQTKRTSERIHRDEKQLKVVSSARMRMVNGVVPADAKITGFAVPLPNGCTKEAQQTIYDATETIATADPFEGHAIIPELGDDDQLVTLADTESMLSQDMCPDADSNWMFTAPSDPGQSCETSPQGISIHIYNPIMATNSNLTGLTVNDRARNSAGASVTQVSTK